ncbi:MAG: PAS domain S-box protein [Anaerolineae bacterium]
MSDDNLSYDALRQRLEQVEATLAALRRGEVDLVIGTNEPLVVRFKSLVEENERLAQHWQATFDAANDAIWVLDGEQRILQSNRTAERFFGKPREIFIGRHCWEIVHGTDAPIPECPILRAKHTLRRERMELPLGERWFQVMVDPILDGESRYAGAVHIISEITERKQMEKALQESEERFRRLAENARDLIYRYEFTPKRGFTYVSPAATAMTGYTPEEHYNDPDLGFKLIHPDDRPLLEAAAKADVSYERPLTLRWVRKDGSILWTEQRNVPIYDQQGNLIALEGIARDITDRKQAEETIREQLDELRRWYAATLGRERRIIELKKEVNELLAQAGQPPRYPSAEQNDL